MHNWRYKYIIMSENSCLQFRQFVLYKIYKNVIVVDIFQRDFFIKITANQTLQYRPATGLQFYDNESNLQCLRLCLCRSSVITGWSSLIVVRRENAIFPHFTYCGVESQWEKHMDSLKRWHNDSNPPNNFNINSTGYKHHDPTDTKNWWHLKM